MSISAQVTLSSRYTYEDTSNSGVHCGLASLSPGQYVQAFRACPSEPLYNLCIGLTFIHMASQKYVLKRHALTVQVTR